MKATREQMTHLLLLVGAHELQRAVVHHVSLLAAGQCTAEECIKRLLMDQVEAMRFLIGRRPTKRLREEIAEGLEMGEE